MSPHQQTSLIAKTATTGRSAISKGSARNGLFLLPRRIAGRLFRHDEGKGDGHGRSENTEDNARRSPSEKLAQDTARKGPEEKADTRPHPYDSKGPADRPLEEVREQCIPDRVIGSPSQPPRIMAASQKLVGSAVGGHHEGQTVEQGSQDEDLLLAEPVPQEAGREPGNGIGDEIDRPQQHDRAQSVEPQVVPDGEIKGRQGELQRMVESMQEGAENQRQVLGCAMRHARRFTPCSEWSRPFLTSSTKAAARRVNSSMSPASSSPGLIRLLPTPSATAKHGMRCQPSRFTVSTSTRAVPRS